MFRTTVKLILVLAAAFFWCCQPISADQFRVVGSFGKEHKARVEQARLSALLDTEVQVRFFAHRNAWRLLVDASVTSKAQLDSHQIESWFFSDSKKMRVTEPTIVAPETKQSIPEPPIRKPETPADEIYPEFEAGESLAEYCQRSPTPRFCQHHRMAEVLEKERKLAAQKAALEENCQTIRDSEAKQVCISWQSGND